MSRDFLAEKEGFEPPDLLQSTVFKTAAFDRSAISPKCLIRYSLNADANIETFFYIRKDFQPFLQKFFTPFLKSFIFKYSIKIYPLKIENKPTMHIKLWVFMRKKSNFAIRFKIERNHV